jgi:hypothetical protein
MEHRQTKMARIRVVTKDITRDQSAYKYTTNRSSNTISFATTLHSVVQCSNTPIYTAMYYSSYIPESGVPMLQGNSYQVEVTLDVLPRLSYIHQ